MDDVERDPNGTGDESSRFLDDLNEAFTDLRVKRTLQTAPRESEHKQRPGETPKNPVFVELAPISAVGPVTTTTTLTRDSFARRLSGGTFVFLALTAFFAYRQWGTMDKTYTEMQKQTAASICAANAAETSAR